MTDEIIMETPLPSRKQLIAKKALLTQKAYIDQKIYELESQLQELRAEQQDIQEMLDSL